ncbi:MAG: STAS domain-containing protein [Coprothermobacterota bacterium]|nr:STAS domain-containing protein [Coprothermobacterota bacterium]
MTEEGYLDIKATQEQGKVPVTVLHLNGNLDVESYEKLIAEAEALKAAGTQNLLLDLKEVPYISSSGLRALNIIFKAYKGDEKEEVLSKGLRDGTYKSPHIKLLNPSKTVMEGLKISGFDMFLEIHKNLKEAVNSF